MAVTQVAAQVTTKRVFNIMSTGQSLMRSVYYSRQTSTKIFSVIGRVSKRWSSSSVAEEGSSSSSSSPEETTTTTTSAVPPAVDADSKSYGKVQEDAHKVASSTHEEHEKSGIDQESLAEVGYDMSKVTKPSGGE